MAISRIPPRNKSVLPKKPNLMYFKVYDDESTERFEEVGKMVKDKKLKWAYHAIDNGKGCHFYRIIKIKK